MRNNNSKVKILYLSLRTKGLFAVLSNGYVGLWQDIPQSYGSWRDFVIRGKMRESLEKQEDAIAVNKDTLRSSLTPSPVLSQGENDLWRTNPIDRSVWPVNIKAAASTLKSHYSAPSNECSLSR